ncbi:hypothetical protein NPX13_g10546 [Xylaria arbuscula]|uniref:Uncharacterized protein n=1 Tax=Xylaria arbuscula TaxID=114810 RepID=A0A9W8N4K6_9PEZI|nr:hypothetical protein NPX13_g10546 [Xylaria arbuscula]
MRNNLSLPFSYSSPAVGYLILRAAFQVVRYVVIRLIAAISYLKAYHDSKLVESTKALEEHVTLSRFLEHMEMLCEQSVDLETLEGCLRELWDEPVYLAEMNDFIPAYLCLNSKFKVCDYRHQRLCSWAYSEDGRTWASAAAKDILQPLHADRLIKRIYGLIAYYRVLGFGKAQLSGCPDDVWNLVRLYELQDWRKLNLLEYLACEISLACRILEYESLVTRLSPDQSSDSISRTSRELVGLRRYCYARILGLSHKDAWNIEENLGQ